MWAHLRRPLWHLIAFLLGGGLAVMAVMIGLRGSDEVMIALIATCFTFCAVMPLVSLQGARPALAGASADHLFAAWALLSGVSALVAWLELVFWGYLQAGFILTTSRPLEWGLRNEVGYVSLFLLLWASGLLVWIGLVVHALRPGAIGALALAGAVVAAGAGFTYLVWVAAYPILWFVGAGVALLVLAGAAAACLTLLDRGGAGAVARRWGP